MQVKHNLAYNFEGNEFRKIILIFVYLFEHIFVAVITFSPFLLCKYFLY